MPVRTDQVDDEIALLRSKSAEAFQNLKIQSAGCAELLGETSIELFATSSRWVAWRLDMRDGKPAKVPYNPHTGGKAKANDAVTWAPLENAEARARKLLSGGANGGVGLMLGTYDEVTLGGLDLDGCRDPATGGIEPWAVEMVRRFNSYAEVSPSGTGLKIFFRYDPADLPTFREHFSGEWGCTFAGDHHGPELHLGNRWYAVTGEDFPKAPVGVRDVTRDVLLWLLTDAGPAFNAARGETKIDRSAELMRLAVRLKAEGGTLDDLRAALPDHPDAAAHVAAQGRQKMQDRAIERAWKAAPEPMIITADSFDDLEDLDDLPDSGSTASNSLKVRIKAFNRRHAFTMIGGKARVIVGRRGGGFDIVALGDLHLSCANDRVRIGNGAQTEPISCAWLRAPARRSYPLGLSFLPEGETPGAFNVWCGWSVKPDPDASCALFLDHLRNNVCHGNADHFEWVLDWMAHLVQRPEEKPGTALVLRGAKGTGKDTVGLYFGALFRPHHVTVSKPEHLTGQFNAHMERALLLHIEEAVWAGDLPECSSHGLRKAIARRLADAGATTNEIAAVTGHRTLSEVQRYTDTASRSNLGKSAIGKL